MEPSLVSCLPWCLDLPLTVGKVTNFQRLENSRFICHGQRKKLKKRARTEAARAERCKRRLFSEEGDENDPSPLVLDPPVLRERDKQAQQSTVKRNNNIWHWLHIYYRRFNFFFHWVKMFIFVFIYSLVVLKIIRNVKLQSNYQATELSIWVCYNSLYKVVNTANLVKSLQIFIINS